MTSDRRGLDESANVTGGKIQEESPEKTHLRSNY